MPVIKYFLLGRPLPPGPAPLVSSVLRKIEEMLAQGYKNCEIF